MPKMPPRPCTNPRCSSYATKNGKCEEHQPVAWASNEGKSRHERGYGNDWYKIRNAALRRDKHLCQPCLKLGIFTPATEVDHIINKAKGGNNNLNNLQSICRSCHKAKTQAESKEK